MRIDFNGLTLWQSAALFELIRGVIYGHKALALGALLDESRHIDNFEQLVELLEDGAALTEQAWVDMQDALFGSDQGHFPSVMPAYSKERVEHTTCTGNTTLTLTPRALVIKRKSADFKRFEDRPDPPELFFNDPQIIFELAKGKRGLWGEALSALASELEATLTRPLQ